MIKNRNSNLDGVKLKEVSTLHKEIYAMKEWRKWEKYSLPGENNNWESNNK